MLLAEQGGITTTEFRARLTERGVPGGIGTVHRFFARHGVKRKRMGRAVEQGRSDVLRQWHRWFDGQLDFDPERQVFIVEA